jgi:hypothetical protein
MVARRKEQFLAGKGTPRMREEDFWCHSDDELRGFLQWAGEDRLHQSEIPDNDGERRIEPNSRAPRQSIAIDLSNSTANQHFLSKAEQELNALNPRAQLSNQRIYSFSLTDREAHRFELDDPRGRSISSNLALRDLFSFSAIKGEQDRLNLEAQFGQYEAGIKTNTLELLRKLKTEDRDIKKEVLELFVSKFINFLRNQFSVHKVLNTIGGLIAYQPTDPVFLAHHRAVLEGKKPHQEHLCRELGIDALTYQRWLAVLFMALFRPAPDLPNLMEGIIKEIFESRAHSAQVAVFQYVRSRLYQPDSRYAGPLVQLQSERDGVHQLHLSRYRPVRGG